MHLTNLSGMKVTITKFTGAGQPTVVVAAPSVESQSEPAKRPALRLIRGGAS